MFAGLKSVASRVRNFLGGSENRSAAKKRFTHRRLELEPLESRVCPTDFSWIGFAANGLWETPANWAGGGAGAFPGYNGNAATTNDTARFSGLISNTNSTMQNAHELAQLRIETNYTMVLTLKGDLTLNNGGYMNNGTIIQRTADFNGAIILTGGTFNWANGNINYSANTATLVGKIEIRAAANMIFNQGLQAGSNLGSDVTIIDDSKLTLNNRGSVTLRNRPVITNNSGHIDITADNLFGLVVPEGDVAQTIINNAGIDMNGGTTATYGIDNPVANHGQLNVHSGTLQFKRADATTGYSVNTDGTVTIDQGNTLRGDNGVSMTAGSFWAGAGTTIATGTSNFKITGGVVYIGTQQGVPGFVNVTGNIVFQAGTMTFYCNTFNNTPVRSRVFCLGGTGITITQAGTAVDVIFFGGGTLGQNTQLDVMQAINGTINSVCGSNPTGWRADRAQTQRPNDTYRLIKLN